MASCATRWLQHCRIRWRLLRAGRYFLRQVKVISLQAWKRSISIFKAERLASGFPIRLAMAVLHRLRIEEPGVFTRVDLALVYLQNVLDGAQSPPDLLVLDLGFADEMGFEVLRFLRRNKSFLNPGDCLDMHERNAK